MTWPLPSPFSVLPAVTLDTFEKSCIEGNACHDRMTSGSSTLELNTDLDTALNMLGESVSLTRMGEEKVWFVSSEPSLAVVMDQSLVPGRSAAVLIGDRGISFAVLHDGNDVVIIDSHAHEDHGGVILPGSLDCVCHTVTDDLKVANVYGSFQCVTLSS